MHMGFHIYDTGFQSAQRGRDDAARLQHDDDPVGALLVLTPGRGAAAHRLRKKFKTGASDGERPAALGLDALGLASPPRRGVGLGAARAARRPSSKWSTSPVLCLVTR